MPVRGFDRPDLDARCNGVRFDLAEDVVFPELVHGQLPEVERHHVERVSVLALDVRRRVREVAREELSNNRAAFHFARRVLRPARRDLQQAHQPIRANLHRVAANHRCFAGVVDANHDRRLQPHIGKEGQCAQGEHSARHAEQSHAIGVRAQSAVHFVVLGELLLFGQMRFVASSLFRTCPRSFPILQTHSSTDSGPGGRVDTVGAAAVCSSPASIFRPAATAFCPPRIAMAATAPPSQPAACGMFGGR